MKCLTVLTMARGDQDCHICQISCLSLNELRQVVKLDVLQNVAIIQSLIDVGGPWLRKERPSRIGSVIDPIRIPARRRIGRECNTSTLDVKTGRIRWNVQCNQGPVYSLAYSPDGAVLACGLYDYTVKLLDVPTGRDLGALCKHISSMHGLAFSPNGCLHPDPVARRLPLVADELKLIRCEYFRDDAPTASQA